MSLKDFSREDQKVLLDLQRWSSTRSILNTLREHLQELYKTNPDAFQLYFDCLVDDFASVYKIKPKVSTDYTVKPESTDHRIKILEEQIELTNHFIEGCMKDNICTKEFVDSWIAFKSYLGELREQPDDKFELFVLELDMMSPEVQDFVKVWKEQQEQLEELRAQSRPPDFSRGTTIPEEDWDVAYERYQEDVRKQNIETIGRSKNTKVKSTIELAEEQIDELIKKEKSEYTERHFLDHQRFSE